MCRHLFAVLLFLLVTSASAAEDDAAIITKRKNEHQPKPSVIDNGTIKIGVDLNLGGAITYLSKSGVEENLVNNWDWGRQIQMSHYSGPAPFRIKGKEIAGPWKNFPWNPLQAGDHFGHASKLLDHANDGKRLYARCRPMQWSLGDAPSECLFETWIALDGPTAQVRCRLTAERADHTFYPAFPQEMPALYLNGPYHRLFSYTGDKPFTAGPLTLIEKKKADPDGFPWSRFLATENWAALVNDADWGVGVWQPHCVSFLGGFAGQPGRGGTKESPTGYIAPTSAEIINHNIVFDYSYVLIVGKLDDIRKQAVALAGPPKPPCWTFKDTRQGWILENATDSGWPIKGTLDISLDKPGVHLVGPVICWQASRHARVIIDAAFPASIRQIKIFWATHSDREFTEQMSTLVPVMNDGEFHRVELNFEKLWNDGMTLTRLRIDPHGSGKGERLRVKEISFR